MRVVCLAFALLAVFSASAVAQNASIRVEVQAETKPVPAATVVINGTSHTTDAAGTLVLPVPPGTIEVTAVKKGFAPATTSVQIAADQEQRVLIELFPSRWWRRK